MAALNYAILRNKACCARLVDVGGMKYVFPLLTGAQAVSCQLWCTGMCRALCLS